jgi:hypothetical protein
MTTGKIRAARIRIASVFEVRRTKHGVTQRPPRQRVLTVHLEFWTMHLGRKGLVHKFSHAKISSRNLSQPYPRLFNLRCVPK